MPVRCERRSCLHWSRLAIGCKIRSGRPKLQIAYEHWEKRLHQFLDIETDDSLPISITNHS